MQVPVLHRAIPFRIAMRTSYRDIALLACCQALLLINNSGLIAMNALVGYALVENKAFATLGATTFVLGSAFAAMPAALWMAKVGRRRGFMTGSAIAVAGAATCALALWLGSFALFCLGTAVIGIYTAFGLQYRFAAVEVAAPEFRAKAISLVLAGGIAGGFLGPQASVWAKDLLRVPFLGSFLVLSAFALIALGVQSQVRVPPPTVEETRGGGRPLSQIARQPVFIVAALSAALGYGIMNLLMTATPLAMSFCSHPFSAAAFVIEWHVVGMYAPGFFTGSLIRRFGALKVIAVGIVLMGAYTPPEKAKTQGMNDVIVFTVMSISSFSSGALVSAAGWDWMNLGALPLLAVVASAVLWLTVLRHRNARV